MNEPVEINTLAKIVTGKTPPTKVKEYFVGNYPFITPSDIPTFQEKCLPSTERTLSDKGKKYQKQLLIPKGAVCYVSIGSTIGKLCKTFTESFTNQQIHSLIPYPEKADADYLYYLLRSITPYIQLVGDGKGSGKPIINKTEFSKIKVTVPDVTTQKIVAPILSAYDDLIEVNNQRIKLLEETARELYKEWFVRMRFPEYKKSKFKKGIPTDWRIEPIGKVIDYHIGGGWGNDNKDNQFSVAGYVIRGTDIPKVRAGQANQDVYRFHKASNMKSRELIEGDMVFETAGGSEGQPLGRTCYITQEMLDAYGDKVMAASFCKQIRTTSIPSLYLYYFLNYLYDTGMIEAFQVQSTGISNYQFEPFLKFQQIILPKDELMQSFHDKAILMQKQIAILGQQNTQLRQIRDRLLPRLISGKLDVKEK